ncbi:MAG: hypothetical protein IJ410_08960 [Oscillospiraceae bacterium]|nr:hypothetical protein [Oscillospiraceae bacterium]
MKKYIFKDNDISAPAAITVAVLALILKLILSYTQFATIYPNLAPIDDHLMTTAAMSIVEGNWLGEYTYLTISKHAFFAVWLAFLHVIKMPYLVANMLLWAAASLAAVMALRPVFRKRWHILFTFLGLLYNPAASAQYATRIYRDAIFPSLCLMFVAGITAVGLRYRESVKKWAGWLVLYGVSFGCIYLCREDGMWIIPYFAAAFVIVTILLFVEKTKGKFVKITAMLLPFVLSAAVIGGYSYMNYIHYGRFIVSDFTSAEFKAAYGALTSLEQDEWHPMVAVPEDVRENVYREVEAFTPVKKALQKPLLVNGYYNETIGDFASGAFYWALREALSDLGMYDTPQTAQQYYEKLTAEIQQAVNEGRLKTSNGKTTLRKSVTPPIKMEYVPDVLAETFAGFKVSILFEQCDPVAHRAVGTPEEITPVEEFINQPGAVALIPYTETPYLSPIRAITHGILRVFNAVYTVCIPVMFVIAVFWQIKKLREDMTNKKFDGETMLNIVMLGLVGMALLRCAMIAFVEVASFGIGTYVMYLSTVHPLLIMYSFTGFCKTFEY